MKSMVMGLSGLAALGTSPLLSGSALAQMIITPTDLQRLQFQENFIPRRTETEVVVTGSTSSGDTDVSAFNRLALPGGGENRAVFTPRFDIVPAKENDTINIVFQFPNKFLMNTVEEQTFTPFVDYQIVDPLSGELMLEAKCGTENAIVPILASKVCEEEPDRCTGVNTLRDLIPGVTFSVAYTSGLTNDDSFQSESFTIGDNNSQQLMATLSLTTEAKTNEVKSGVNPFGLLEVAPIVLLSAINNCYELTPVPPDSPAPATPRPSSTPDTDPDPIPPATPIPPVPASTPTVQTN